MKLRFLGLAGLLFFADGAFASGFSLFASREPDIVTVTDITEAGKNYPAPEPGRPVYYEAISYGTKNFPGLAGDPSPPHRPMLNLIQKTLAEQGYLVATRKGQATLYLSFGWGYSRANLGSLGFLGGDKLGLMWELENPSMLPPQVLFRNARSLEASKLMDLANSDLYIASIQAFDLKEIDAGKKNLLWHTRIACSATGLSMTETMPAMIVAAGPFIGRAMKRPVFKEVPRLREGHVEIGNSEVIEYLKR